jgi:NitT/TauT family transport system ATP-binding protein
MELSARHVPQQKFGVFIMSVDQGTLPSNTHDSKIVLRDVRRVFPLRKEKGFVEDFVALGGVDFAVKSGEFVAVVGPSGCGKSTLLDILAGLGHPTSGEVLIDGKVVKGPALDRGIVLQGYALFPWRNVRQNVEFGLEVKKVPKAKRREISDRFIRLVGLDEFRDHLPHELSGGMRQRVALARALAYDPDILLMDEPFAAVDAQTREVLQEELLRIWETTKKTVIFVTHSIEEAVFLSDRVVVLSTNPGVVRDIVTVDLPRPRTADGVRSSEVFTAIRHQVWQLLQSKAPEALQ